MEAPTPLTDRTLKGLDAITLENRMLHVVILPWAGARIWQITYKPLNADVLWNNPQVAPARQPLFASYDDAWCGGWDELFPNDEAGTIEGTTFPDHGELWTGEWTASEFAGKEAAISHLEFSTPISRFHAEKTIRLLPDRPVGGLR